MLVQWNCDGFYPRLERIQQLISDTLPNIICLQETNFKETHKPYLRGYESYHRLRTSFVRASGGASIFVTSDCFSRELPILTNLEAVAVEVWCPQKITICSVYIPPSYNLTEAEVQDLIRQLPNPFIIVGDFNAHSAMWGSENTFGRGKIIENVVSNSNVCLLNTGDSTHFNVASGSFSCIDLSFCDPSTAPLIAWRTLDSLYDSNHYPIVISDNASGTVDSVKRWKLAQADWVGFSAHAGTQTGPLELSDNIDEATSQIINCITTAAKKYIGKYEISPTRKIVPWWNEACKNAVRECKSALNRYRRTRSQEDLVNFKRLRAKSKRTLKESKAESWRKYVATLRTDTPPGQVWKKVRQIQGHTTVCRIPALVHNNMTITDSQKIVDLFADHFQAKRENISIPQLPHGLHTPQPAVSRDSNPLNAPFTQRELLLALSTCRNSSAGPDDIPFCFLKNLSLTSLNKLLELYNKIWTKEKFPTLWRKSIILPIKKNDSNPTNPNSFRPISLTCTMCKLLEKMVNKRLLWYLDKHELLNPSQSGFRPNRSTMDNLVALQAEISEAFTTGRDVIAVALDLEGAFDKTLKSLVCSKLDEMIPSGNMTCFIKNFLTNRTSRVTANGKTSHQIALDNGVPQGSVLSTTLFLLAVNDVCSSIQPPVRHAAYADDLILFCSGRVPSITCDLLQQSVNSLLRWSAATGFTFSATKTKVIKFSRRRNNHVPQISLNGAPLQVTDHLKFLGLTFDSKLTWKRHIEDTKGQCLNRLNILKTLSHYHWGAEEEVLLRVYRALIRSKLDYGSLVYSSASKTNLKRLDVVHNSALRICLGAFRSSPVQSLYCESNELPLMLRREQLILTYSARVSANPNNPVFDIILPAHTPPASSLTRLQSFPQTLKSLTENIDLTKTASNPTSAIPPWIKLLPRVNKSLSTYRKHDTPDYILKLAYLNLIGTHNFDVVLYTDASKSETGVGCSVTTSDSVISRRLLSTHCSVHTAELYGILTALRTITGPNQTVAVCSDSLSSINSIENMYTQNPLVQEIHEICHRLADIGVSITLVWVPSHVGINGNERADQAAKEALTSNLIAEEIQLHNDLKNLLRRTITTKWQNLWQQSNAKLRTIQPSVPAGKLPHLNRRDMAVIRRLRIGHTRATHGYLMALNDPPTCAHCNSRLTVEHILTECPQYSESRRNHSIQADLKMALSTNLENVINFLHDIQMYQSM